MRVLFITHAVFLDPTRISAGNSVRGFFLAKGLVERGHQVTFACPSSLERFSSKAVEAPEPGIRVASFSDRAGLARLLEEQKPGVLLVGYWELLDELPEAPGMPVVLDVVAPRVLEAMFQPERELAGEVRRMLALYRKADHFLVGTERQRHFLLPWLIMAGFDCREDIPIDVLPISTRPCTPRESRLDDGTVRFVSGGVAWPWRRTKAWFDAVVKVLRALSNHHSKLTLFSGQYVYSSDSDGQATSLAPGAGGEDVLESHDLISYGEMQHYLETQCHVGIELADRNVEREYSQSFRAMEFLRAGLPLICNDYLELAAMVHHYDAGWVVSAPDELSAVINEILHNPETVRCKSSNALKLVKERFHYQKTIEPLVRFVEHPIKRPKGPMLLQDASTLATSPARQRQVTLFRRSLMAGKRWAVSLASRLALVARKNAADGEIVIVTRADVFPADHGAAVKIDRTAAALSYFVGAVYLVTDDRRHYHVYRNGVVRRERFPLWLSGLAPPRCLVRRRVARRGIPADNAFLYYPLFDWSYVIRTLYLALRHPIAIFQAEFPAYARACLWGRELLGGKVILVEHNVEYQRLRAQANGLTPDAFEFMRAVEVGLCNLSDLVVVVSQLDQAQLIADGVQPERMHYVPHGVDLAAFDAAQTVDLRCEYCIGRDEAVLVYHGTYMYPPNLEAMQVMAERILPRLKSRGFKLKILAIGSHPPQQTPHEDIIFTGSVADVAPYLRAADMAVVPLLKGGGTRMKILDYFAAGLPVVSTAKGIEGIPVTNGVEAVIVDDADEAFANQVMRLLENPLIAREIGRRGRVFVENLDWKEIGRRYLELIEDRLATCST